MDLNELIDDFSKFSEKEEKEKTNRINARII